MQLIQTCPIKQPCEERNVLVNKAPTEPLGISVAGGRHSQRGDTPIYVTNINPDCILGREKLVIVGRFSFPLWRFWIEILTSLCDLISLFCCFIGTVRP